MDDLISRQATYLALVEKGQASKRYKLGETWELNGEEIREVLDALPSTQPEINCSEIPNNSDTISKQAAIDAILKINDCNNSDRANALGLAEFAITTLPPAQPERTCVNCGRTVNNGGWYADGRTRCPIEEHYALPKDGFCYLWEKRNVTDDDYPERREE